jgi:Fe-S-cluster containining protein
MPKNRISELLATQEVVELFRHHFACRRCGACCTQFDGVRVTTAEMKHLDVPRDEWDDTFSVMGSTYYMKQPCRFFSAGKSRCTIYNERPETCRRFPMYAIKCDDGLQHLAVSEICPAAVEALAEVEAEWLGR